MKFRPALDPEFVPASLWNRAYRARVKESGGGRNLAIALERSDGSVSVFRTAVLPHEGANVRVNHRYVERLLKFLLWQKGGYRITIAGRCAHRAITCASVYSPGRRARLRLRVHGRAGLRPAHGDRERLLRRRSRGTRDRRAAGPPPGRLPHRLRPGRQRPQVRRRGRWQGGVQRRSGLEPQRAGRSAISFRRHPGFAAARRRASAARGRHRGQRRGRVRE